MQFIASPDSSLIYTGVYNQALVAMSMVIAVLAAYAALLVSQYLAQPVTKLARRLWLAVASVCFGIGIWSMHFIGMLAFSLPCATGFDWSITLLSMLPSILGSAMALQIISRPTISKWQLALGGLLLGAGIGTMHYVGMAAMRLEGLLRYHLGLVLLSVVVAVGLATLAIWIKFHLPNSLSRWKNWSLPLSALVLGLAVSAMHYTAMAAAYFIRDGDSHSVESVLTPNFLAYIVLAVSLLLIVLTVVATYVAKPKVGSLTQSYAIIATLALGWALASWVIAERYNDHQVSSLYQQTLADATKRASEEATLLDESLQLLKAIPQMFAQSAEVQKILHGLADNAQRSSFPLSKQQQRADANLIALSKTLHATSLQFKADAITVLDSAGDCVASNNHDSPESFVGTNYSEREYFKLARSGQPGHQFALGLKTGVPGIFYAQPVHDQGRFVGAIVVKRNMARLSGRIGQAQAFISDTNGVVIWAADKSLEFKRLPGAQVAQLPPETVALQYGTRVFDTLPIQPWGDSRLPLAVRLGQGQSQSQHPSVLVSQVLADGLLTIHAVSPLPQWDRLSYEKWGFFVLIVVAGGLLVLTAFSMLLYLGEMRRVEAEIRQLAFYDPLTKLPNRRLVFDRLQQTLTNTARSAQMGALFFLDLDNFKTLNDTQGHDQGDELLQQVAQRLSLCVREVDTVARLGGDEFVVLLDGLSQSATEAEKQARTVGATILQELNRPYQLAGSAYRSTPSLGVTLFSGHQDSASELLKRADIAMYQAKAAGRNTLLFFDPAMQSGIRPAHA